MRRSPAPWGPGSGAAPAAAALDPPRDSHILVLVLTALVARLAVILPQIPPFLGGGQALDSFALRIASGIGFGPSSSLPPLYPFFLGMLYRIYGYSSHPVVLSQAVIGSLTVIPVMLLARVAGLQRREVFLAGLLFALFPQAVAETRHLTPVVLLSALFLTGVLIWLRGPGLPGIGDSLLAGVLAGATVLGRVGMLLPVLVLILSRGVYRYRLAPRAGLHWSPPWGPRPPRGGLHLWMRRGFLILALAVVLAPWIVRSTHLHGRAVFVESSWALRLRAANVPDTPFARYAVPGSGSRVPDNLILTDNKIAFQEFLGYASTHPGALVLTWARRAVLFLSFTPRSDAAPSDPFPYRFLWFRLLHAAIYGTILTLVLAWLILLKGAGGAERALAALVLGCALLGITAGGTGDARLFSLPFLVVLAGRGSYAMPLLWRVGRGRRILFFCLATALWVAGFRAGGVL